MHMKTPTLALALIALPLLAGGALAADTCTLPAGATAQSEQALQQKLEGEGWQVAQIRLENGCYQVTATKADGTRLDSDFDPATLAPVGSAVSEEQQIANFLNNVQGGAAGGGDDDDDNEGDDDGEHHEDGEHGEHRGDGDDD